MADLLLLALGASLVDSFVLAGVLGSRTVAPPSRRVQTAMRIGVATACVVTTTSALGYVVWRTLLVPFALGDLRLLMLVLLVAALAQAADRLAPVLEPARRESIERTVPLLTINGVLLVSALPGPQPMDSLLASLALGAASGVGFAITLLLFTLLQQRIDSNDVPQAFRGAPIAFVTAGMMALAVIGLDGIGVR